MTSEIHPERRIRLSLVFQVRISRLRRSEILSPLEEIMKYSPNIVRSVILDSRLDAMNLDRKDYAVIRINTLWNREICDLSRDRMAWIADLTGFDCVDIDLHSEYPMMSASIGRYVIADRRKYLKLIFKPYMEEVLPCFDDIAIFQKSRDGQWNRPIVRCGPNTMSYRIGLSNNRFQSVGYENFRMVAL